MDIAAMTAAVLAATQFLKNLLKGWGLNVEKAWSIFLSLIVSVGVVLYFHLNGGIPITLDSFWLLVQVFALANGGKQLIASIKPK